MGATGEGTEPGWGGARGERGFWGFKGWQWVGGNPWGVNAGARRAKRGREDEGEEEKRKKGGKGCPLPTKKGRRGPGERRGLFWPGEKGGGIYLLYACHYLVI